MADKADAVGEKAGEQQKVGEVLKEFAANVTTSKTKERRRILAELEQCVLAHGKSFSGECNSLVVL